MFNQKLSVPGKQISLGCHQIQQKKKKFNTDTVPKNLLVFYIRSLVIGKDMHFIIDVIVVCCVDGGGLFDNFVV